MVDDNTWPPGNSPHFYLFIIKMVTVQKVTAMAEVMYKGDIDKVASVTVEQSTVTHDKLDGHKKF